MIRYRIREICQARKISQNQFGYLAQLEQGRVRLIFRGGTSEDINLTMQVLDRIAKALQVDASELIESVPDE